MSTFEERLSQLNLAPFKNEGTGTSKEIKYNLFKEFVKQLWKYQHYKNEVVLTKINKLHYSPHTIKNYMSYLRTYVQYGKKYRGAGPMFYDLIDEFKSRFEATLTPSKYERHTSRGCYKPRKCVPEIYISEDVVEAVKSYLTPACQSFGVLCENKIRIFDSKEYCLGFIDCYKTVGDGKEVKLIKMNYEVIDENN